VDYHDKHVVFKRVTKGCVWRQYAWLREERCSSNLS